MIDCHEHNESGAIIMSKLGPRTIDVMIKIIDKYDYNSIVFVNLNVYQLQLYAGFQSQILTTEMCKEKCYRTEHIRS